MTTKTEVRIWKGAPARLMGGPIEGYVMARRRGAAPFVVALADWVEAPLAEPDAGAKISPRLLRPAAGGAKLGSGSMSDVDADSARGPARA